MSRYHVICPTNVKCQVICLTKVKCQVGYVADEEEAAAGAAASQGILYISRSHFTLGGGGAAGAREFLPRPLISIRGSCQGRTTLFHLSL